MLHPTLSSCHLAPSPAAANGATAVLSGTVRGTGRQKLGAIVNGVSNYALGLPAQLLLAFAAGRGVVGLWWGLAGASAVQSVVLALLLRSLDWSREAARAAKLVHHLSIASLLLEPEEGSPVLEAVGGELGSPELLEGGGGGGGGGDVGGGGGTSPGRPLAGAE